MQIPKEKNMNKTLMQWWIELALVYTGVQIIGSEVGRCISSTYTKEYLEKSSGDKISDKDSKAETYKYYTKLFGVCMVAGYGLGLIRKEEIKGSRNNLEE